MAKISVPSRMLERFRSKASPVIRKMAMVMIQPTTKTTITQNLTSPVLWTVIVIVNSHPGATGSKQVGFEDI
jgi:hypothetical protein